MKEGRGEGERSKTSDSVLQWQKYKSVRESIQYFPKVVYKPSSSNHQAFVKICQFVDLISDLINQNLWNWGPSNFSNSPRDLINIKVGEL